MPMYLHENEEGDEPSLYITCRDRTILHFPKVRMNPVRHDGVWVICHDMLGRPASSWIPAEDVWYFTVVDDQPEEGDADA